MNAQIISIGAELILGQTVDTNAAWLAQRIAAHGIVCTKHLTVGDDRPVIAEMVRTASGEADLVLVSGGLGPTPDDLTRDAIADALGTELRLHQPSLDQIAAFFAGRKRSMTESNKVQAMLPYSATAIPNAGGTAPGIHACLNDADIYCMPGVPREMKAMFDRDVLPTLTGKGDSGVILGREIHLFGMPESTVGEKIADLMTPGRNPAVGTSAGDWVITVRVKAHGANPDKARQLVDKDAAVIYARMGRAAYGEGDETLAHAVAKLLIEQGKTIATAESCTGGLLAKRLTDVSGSSAYMIQGVVTYANEAKCRLLEVPMELIETHGAVSKEVAETMAANCRRLAGTDYALATTGVAGPTGGTREKPVGLVFVALAGREDTIVKEIRCGETLTREAIRDRAAKVALDLLRRSKM